MKPRAVWKGWLKFHLIACPVALYKATSEPERVSFTRINRKTGHKIETQWLDAGSQKPVESADIGKGVEVAPGKYVEVTDEEIGAVAPKSTTLIEISGIR